MESTNPQQSMPAAELVLERSILLGSAVSDNNRACAKEQLAGGADPFIKIDSAFTCLDLAIHRDDMAMVRLMLEEHVKPHSDADRPDSADSVDTASLCRTCSELYQAFHIAVAYCSVNCLAYLLDCGLEPSRCESDDGRSLPPITAICEAHINCWRYYPSKESVIDCAKLLIKHGALIEHRDDATSALHGACVSALDDVVPHLLQSGADVNSLVYYQTPLMALCHEYKSEESEAYITISEQLIRHGADVNLLYPLGSKALYKEFSGWSVLHFAVSSQALPLVQLLLESGADPNWQETVLVNHMDELFNLHSCLSLAVSRENNDILRLLLEWNAESLPGSSDKVSPFFNAVKNQNLTSAKLLFYNGAGESRGKMLHCIEDTISSSSSGDHLDDSEDKDVFLSSKSVEMKWLRFKLALMKPLSLSQICRIVVRRCIGKRLAKDNLFLPLPKRLIQYIKVCDEGVL